MESHHQRDARAFPISDAGLGATAYTIEMLMGWMSGKERWRTMPWMVTFFFILVVPLGIVSIVLVIPQPIAVGYWCSICLFTALLGGGGRSDRDGAIHVRALSLPRGPIRERYANWNRLII